MLAQPKKELIMYLLVRIKDSVIIGTAKKALDEKSCAGNGYNIYEIDDTQFKNEMLGAKLESFQIVK